MTKAAQKVSQKKASIRVKRKSASVSKAVPLAVPKPKMRASKPLVPSTKKHELEANSGSSDYYQMWMTWSPLGVLLRQQAALAKLVVSTMVLPTVLTKSPSESKQRGRRQTVRG